MDKFVEYNLGDMQQASVSEDLFVNRASYAEMQQQYAPAEVTIIVIGLNRVEKTKRCVESILQYTKGIDYELILVDNGSTDETLEYFKSVPYEKKRILRFSKNLGASFPSTMIPLGELGRYVVPIPNDLILTERWLDNLLLCMNSDPKIGLVVSASSNASNLQGVEFAYSSYEEMQQMAAKYNVSDPSKWEDRLRMVTLCMVIRKEALLALGWPRGDVGFFHDFSDDDISFGIRRAGYRVVFAGDTWVCHDHRVLQGEGKDPVQFQQSLKIGRENFRSKYFGIDAWDDVNNFLRPYLDNLPAPKQTSDVRILGIDVRCGTPILDVKNRLRKFGIYNAELSAFTQDPKYWLDLKTICAGTVSCDREEFLTDNFAAGSFDYVVADRPINRYHEPQKILNDMFALAKPGGVIICKLKNTASFQEYINMLGERNVYDQEFSYNIPLEVFGGAIDRLGKLINVTVIPFPVTDEQCESLREMLPEGYTKEEQDNLITRLISNEFLIIAEKA